MESTNKACSFTGHRTIPVAHRDMVAVRLNDTLVHLIEKKGVDTFIAGGALGFDTTAALAVLSLKNVYPSIKLILAIPCENQTKGWSDKAVALYNDIMKKADEVIYTGKEYTSGCMHVRNRFMVDNSEYCVAYKTRESGGTAYTYKYALEQGKTVINIAE